MKQLDKEQERAAIALLEALEAVAPAERDAWLDAHAENKLVADRVRSMLAALNRLSLQTGGAQADDLEIGQPPDRIGAYRITGTIGRGGMGTVYLGERDAGDFERVVAIKLIKAGLLSERLVERFGAERQTLAALQHPNIARMYDGGATPQGEPYIVMEYVDGVPILNRCDAACSQDKRLALFADVCAAVAYAHNNLIVHRDITPSNVLVTTDDVVKLIDFGIARPAGYVTDDATTRQSLASLTLTPGYAAPERMLGSEATVATDIYSLGKLLDALLDGSRDRELEAIIAKATDGEPDARYSTADALRADITNFRTNLPVTAMRRDRSYLWQKFFARNRIAVIAGAAALGALVIAFAATGWALIRAETARAEAERRFGEVRSLAGFQLFDLYDRLDNVVGNVGARVALAAEAQRYLANLSASELADSALKLEAARGHIKLALIQGVSARPNLGDFDNARGNLDTAQRLIGTIKDLPVAATAPHLAQVHAYRALILTHADSKPKEARVEITRCEAALGPVPAAARDRDFMLARSDCRLSLLEWLDSESAIEPLDRAAQQLEADIAEWPAAMQRSPRADFDRALAMHFRATVGYSSEAPAARAAGLDRNLQSERMFADLERRFPNDPLIMYRRAYNAFYGHHAASQIERDDVAQTFLTQARRTVERLLSIETEDESLITFEERLREAQADFYAVTERFDEAIAMQRSVVTSREALMAQDPSSNRVSNLGYGHAILGVIARRAGNRTLACSSWQEAERLIGQVAARGDLRGYVAEMRGGIQRNITRCERGEPVSSFGALQS